MYERLLTLSDYFNYLNRRVPEELDHAFEKPAGCKNNRI